MSRCCGSTDAPICHVRSVDLRQKSESQDTNGGTICTSSRLLYLPAIPTPAQARVVTLAAFRSLQHLPSEPSLPAEIPLQTSAVLFPAFEICCQSRPY